MTSYSKKRGRSMFDSVKLLETQDAAASKKRHVSTKRDLARSKAATGQTKVYGSLMECRIMLQRSIQTVHAETTNNDSDTDNDNEQDNKEAVEKCNQLLAKLLEARERLVPSVSEDDEDETTDYNELTANSDSSQLEQKLQSQYDICQTEWKQTLNRRHKDVRLHAGLTAKAQFRVMDSSFWEQVDATVQHEQLLSGNNNNNNKDDDDHAKQPVFDDTKVYQHLLKDFVLASQAGGQEGVQQLRLKHSQAGTKKMVDRKASKGRKIRYNEVTKLVNFTFPLSRPANANSNLDQGEWFRSLFGGAGNSNPNNLSQTK